MSDYAGRDWRCAVDTNCTSTVIHVRKSVGLLFALKRTTKGGIDSWHSSLFFAHLTTLQVQCIFDKWFLSFSFPKKGGLRRGLSIQKCRRLELWKRPDIYTSGTDVPSIWSLQCRALACEQLSTQKTFSWLSFDETIKYTVLDSSNSNKRRSIRSMIPFFTVRSLHVPLESISPSHRCRKI